MLDWSCGVGARAPPGAARGVGAGVDSFEAGMMILAGGRRSNRISEISSADYLLRLSRASQPNEQAH